MNKIILFLFASSECSPRPRCLAVAVLFRSASPSPLPYIRICMYSFMFDIRENDERENILYSQTLLCVSVNKI